MKQTRRNFIKFLGKTAVVGAAIAVAPKTVLGFKPQVPEYRPEIIKAAEIIDGTVTFPVAPLKGEIVQVEYEQEDYGRGPMTATEIIQRKEEWHKLNEPFLRAFEKEVFKSMKQRGAILKNL